MKIYYSVNYEFYFGINADIDINLYKIEDNELILLSTIFRLTSNVILTEVMKELEKKNIEYSEIVKL